MLKLTNRCGTCGFQKLASWGVLIALAACAAEVAEPPEAELTAEALALTPRWKASGGGALAFSPDGRSVATGSTSTVLQLLAANNGQARASFKIRHLANAAAFSPDGSLLAVGSGGPGQTLGLSLFCQTAVCY